MESNKLILSPISFEDLQASIREIIKSELMAKLNADHGERLLSPAEACKFFLPPITKPTISAWTKKGLLQDHRIGGRVFYKQSEILDSLQTLKKYKVT